MKLLFDHDSRAYSESDVSPATHTPVHCEIEYYRAAIKQSETLTQNCSCLKELQE